MTENTEKGSKKIIIISLLILLILLLAFSLFSRESSGADLLADSATIYTYQLGDAVTDFGFMEVNFKKDSTESWYANGSIDLNQDGIFSEEEWLVRNFNISVTQDYPNRFSFALPESLKVSEWQSADLSFALSQEKVTSPDQLSEEDLKTLEAQHELIEVKEQFGLNVPGANENLKRGVGIAQAQESGSGQAPIPDLSAGPMDCFAVATANNLISLAEKNGRRGDLPEDPQEIIAELKNAMQWNNGIINANFLTGKADYIAVYDLPIETKEIKRPSIEDLKEALERGDAVEISTQMLRSKSNQANTGHVLTGVSASQDGQIGVHDPATPVGEDFFEVSMTGGETPYILIEYPMWDGIVIVDAIYIQTWTSNESGVENSSALDEDEEEAEEILGGYNLESSFAHVKPGEYSEIYSLVSGLEPGQEIEVFLKGDSPNGRKKTGVADENGTVHHTWRITSFGNYSVEFTPPGASAAIQSSLQVN